MASLPFATVQDVKDRYPDFPAGGETFCEKLIEDVTDLIITSHNGAPITASPATIRRIVCKTVIRYLANSTQMLDTPIYGANSFQMGAGPYQQSVNFAAPFGDLYLSKQDRKDLGLGVCKAFSVDLLTGQEYV